KTRRDRAPVPTRACAGLSAVKTGGDGGPPPPAPPPTDGPVIVNVSGEVSAVSAGPGIAVTTSIVAVPALAKAAAGPAASSVALFRKVVGRAAPFQRTSDTGRKLAPSVRSVSPGPPAVTWPGSSELRIGSGAPLGSARGTAVKAAPIATTDAAMRASGARRGRRAPSPASVLPAPRRMRSLRIRNSEGG